ncbi:MAG: rhomboid family intramembrane serine protease [Saprospiraceae bacterium]|nr:rhomboid family intramembrane serine protease [Saprospiraceae bacterium]
MIFPIGDDQIKGGYKPIFSYSFIAINVLLYLFEVSLISSGQLSYFIEEYGAIPVEISSGKDLYTLFTNIFLHGGWMHLIGNMLFLWIFADNIEATIGNIRFLLFYLGSGMFASLIHVLFNLESSIPSIGASGAISAVLGSYLVMFPRSRVRILVIYFFSSFNLSAYIFLGLWIVFQVISGISAMNQSPDSGGVAYWAHIGGFGFGIVYGLIAKRYFKLEGSIF